MTSDLTPGNKLRGAHIRKNSPIRVTLMSIAAAVGATFLVGVGILFGYYTSR